MSTPAQIELWTKIMSKLSTRLENSTKKIRDTVEERLGQIYIFDPEALTKTVQDMFTGSINYKGFGLTKNQIENVTRELDIKTKYRQEWQEVLRNCEKLAKQKEDQAFKGIAQRKTGGLTNIQRQEYIKKILMGEGEGGRLPLPAGATAYLFRNYNFAVEYQKEISDKYIRPFLKNTVIPNLKGVGVGKVKESLLASVDRSFLNVGHGATIGASVAATQTAGEIGGAIARAKAANLPEEQIAKLQRLYDSTLQRYSKVGLTTEDINISLKQTYFIDTIKRFYLTTRGTFRGGYTSVLSLQSAWDNNMDSKEEKAIKEDVKVQAQKLSQEILETPGSTSLLEGFERVIFYSTIGKNKFKTKGKSQKEYKSTNKISINFSAEAKIKSGKKKKAQKVTPNLSTLKSKERAKTVVNQKEMSASPLEMIAYINRSLPVEVDKLMVAPRLETRTGRFAQSVQVRNITQTKQGFPLIDYTYQRDPYQVFEMGIGRIPWATRDRDPRPLIDRAIRNIAAEMLKARIYTRRI